MEVAPYYIIFFVARAAWNIYFMDKFFETELFFFFFELAFIKLKGKKKKFYISTRLQLIDQAQLV